MFPGQMTLTLLFLPSTPDWEGRGQDGPPRVLGGETEGRGPPRPCGGGPLSSEGKGPVYQVITSTRLSFLLFCGLCGWVRSFCFSTKNGNVCNK